MKKVFNIVRDTPWKATSELLMYVIKPFVNFYLRLCGVEIGSGSKFYGFPKVLKHRGSRIIIGKNFECRNWQFSNPLGLNHPTMFCTWSRDAQIRIGDDVGISGASIVASSSIEIGNNTLVGANATIIDTDFHPTKGQKRYAKKGIKVGSVKIGKNVFIGMNCTILKGVRIKSDSVIAAGLVVR